VLAPASGKGVISPRRIMDDRGQQSCRVCLAKVPVVRDTNMVTGAEDVSGEGRCVRGRQMCQGKAVAVVLVAPPEPPGFC
jgi:hypothetical protein